MRLNKDAGKFQAVNNAPLRVTKNFHIKSVIADVNPSRMTSKGN